MRQALEMALEALRDNQHLVADNERHVYVMEYNSIIEKCEEALAKPEQEPVAYINIEDRKLEWAYKYMSWDTPTVINLPKIPLYTTPPHRKPLTEDELELMCEKAIFCRISFQQFARAIEAAHNIKE